MWQRKQTLFLFCSVIAIAICLFEPIGIAYTNTGIGEGHLMMNLDFNGISNADTIRHGLCLPLQLRQEYSLYLASSCITTARHRWRYVHGQCSPTSFGMFIIYCSSFFLIWICIYASQHVFHSYHVSSYGWPRKASRMMKIW